MRHQHRDEERSAFPISLTDCTTIAAEVDWLQAQGYSELTVWRHFLEHFVVDLDALSLIIATLFGHAELGIGAQIAMRTPPTELPRAA